METSQKEKTIKKVLLINGPNLNLLGIREPEIYGQETLENIEENTTKHASSHGINVETFQSNHEGAIVDKIGAAYKDTDAIIINPAALSHTSVAIADAISGVDLPTIEVHISNIYARAEDFRHTSLISPVATAVITGMQSFGYILAIDYLTKL